MILKKLAAAAMTGMCLCVTPLSAWAATTSFNVTVGAGTEDPMSKRTMKAGGAAYENCFYVTVNSMTPSDGMVYVKSLILNGPLGSDEVSVYSGTRGASGNYHGTAPYDQYYYMNSRYGGSQIAPQITMSGRYTP